MTLIYTARWALPIVAPAIVDGAVAIEGPKIAAIGPRSAVISRFPAAPVSDFGRAAILPGLVNAHSHLELTVMRGFLEREENDFFAWLRKLTVARMSMTEEDLFVSAACGAIEAARAGITCLGDSSSSACQSMKALREIGLRGIVYQESFGPDPTLADQNVGKLFEQLAEMRLHESELVRAGVSPHSPYTVSAPQLELISRLAINERLPLMMHAAESQAEKQFMLEGRGPFAEGLRGRGIHWPTPGISTVAYLARHGILETKPLLAHCINVDDHDLEVLEKSGAGIAHCPKSNAKLSHGCGPFASFLSHGIDVGLGSDSVASNNTCDILEEARFATLVARLQASDGLPPVVTAEQSLFAATLGGARALGLDSEIGALREGAQADIAIVNLSSTHQEPVRNPADALIFCSSGRDVILTMVAGKAIYSDNRMSNLDERELQIREAEIRSRLDAPR